MQSQKEQKQKNEWNAKAAAKENKFHHTKGKVNFLN
jgi:hypothetical protein